jgi:hypothetical protein
MIIVKYLDRVSGSIAAGSQFFALAVMFYDLNSGIKNNLFQPSRGRGRRHDTTEIWLQRADVAFSVECLVRKAKARGVELTVKEAAKKIAAESPNLKALKRSPGTTLITSIENWHKEFTQGRVKNLLAQSEFNSRLE